MLWLSALIKAILEWLTSLAKQDTKASDADDIPQALKESWRDRIDRQLKKQEDQKALLELEKRERGLDEKGIREIPNDDEDNSIYR